MGLATGAAWAGNTATEGRTFRQDLEVVECLLPGQVRKVGGATFLTPRRPVRTTTADCRIRGGEYVDFSRADYATALHVWMATAETGDAEAQTNVGEIYERGLGGEPNYEAAVFWYRKAAGQGYSRARFNLGTLYEQGLGVEQDKLEALNLYRLAWGLPEDSIISKSAAHKMQEEVLTELRQVISKQNDEIALLQTQLDETERKLATARDRATEASSLKQKLSTLQGLVSRLQVERQQSTAKMTAVLVATTRQAQSSGPALPPPDPTAEAVAVKGMEFGRFYALIIGNQDYQQLTDLQTPRADAARAARVLRDKYGFTVQIVNDADDVAMLRALNDLNPVLRPNDNLLIYYAGHGARLPANKNSEIGYWLPVNAEPPPSDTFWLPNEQVVAHLARLPAKRVLMVSDSCFAGLLSSDPGVSIFGTEDRVSLDYVRYKLPKRSRLLLASGGDEPVLDQGGSGNSVFADVFLKVLEDNSDILSTPALFSRVRAQMASGPRRMPLRQEPQLKSIKASGHEVGDFFFVPKES